MSDEPIEEIAQDEIEEKDATPISVIVKKEETKPDPDFDYDSDQLSDKDIEKLEIEIDQSIKKRVNKDTI